MVAKVMLKSSSDTINPEQHFKLIAGPGAGKTQFLINHLSNVQRKSKRLGKNKKIACITYTNSGVKTIAERIEESSDRIEICTIHSFLYKHVVKPYLWTMKDLNFPYDMLDGHEQPKHGYTFLNEFKSKTNQWHLDNDQELNNSLNRIKWIFNENQELQPGIYKVHHGKVGKYNIRKESYIQYKELCWEKGIMSHDDILYFGYKLLSENESIREIIRAKFPYIFVDEFQDTNPIQSEILKRIGQKESIIGVIGDPAQSIYSFQGADVKSFNKFMLNDMKVYIIDENRRSSNEIIALANHVRTEADFMQSNPDNRADGQLCILVGDTIKNYSKYKSLYNPCISDTCVISYKNKVAKDVQTIYKGEANLDLNLFYEDNERGKMIHFIMKAIEYGVQMKVKDAMKYLLRAYRRVDEYTERKAISDLKWLLNNYDKISESSLKEFYNQYIYGRHGVKQKVTRGKYAELYVQISYKELSKAVNIIDDTSNYKTIHKVKGEEYRDIFLILTDEKDLSFIINPDINKEENRVYYVAITRAMKNLMINVPSLENENEKQLKKLGFQIKR